MGNGSMQYLMAQNGGGGTLGPLPIKTWVGSNIPHESLEGAMLVVSASLWARPLS